MNLSQNENLSVNNQLRNLIEAYLEKHPTLTLNALALRCSIPATTMRRLMQRGNGAESKNEFAPHSVLSLMSYILKEKKISTLLKKVDGPIAELLKKSFDQFIFDEDSSTHSMDAELNALFQDKTTYLIYKLAANVCGTTMNDIRNIFGLLGLQKLNELIEKKWIIADSDDCEKFHAVEKNFTVDLPLAHQLTHSLVEFYKPKEVDLGFNLFYSLSEGMTEAGIKKIKEIEKDAVKKIYEIMNNKSFQGTIPYFTIVLSDILGITPAPNRPEGVLQ